MAELTAQESHYGDQQIAILFGRDSHVERLELPDKRSRPRIQTEQRHLSKMASQRFFRCPIQIG
jgi:hypothetical protein